MSIPIPAPTPLETAKTFYMHECCNLVTTILEESHRLRLFCDKVMAKPNYDPKEPWVNPQASRALSTLILEIARLSRLLSSVPKEATFNPSYSAL